MTKNVLTPLKRRFHEKFRIGDGCWEWIGALNKTGCGVINSGRRGGGLIYAHRLSYEIHRGPIGAGLLVCHTCDNPKCINPAHLFLGDHKANSEDMVRKGRHRPGPGRPKGIPQDVWRKRNVIS